MDAKDDRFILEVLAITSEYDCHGDIWWRTDGKYAPVSFFVNCNDVFNWGTADCEDITPDNVAELRVALKDATAVDPIGSTWGAELFCARQRQMRPQTPWYENLPAAIAELFNACGPKRDV